MTAKIELNEYFPDVLTNIIIEYYQTPELLKLELGDPCQCMSIKWVKQINHVNALAEELNRDLYLRRDIGWKVERANITIVELNKHVCLCHRRKTKDALYKHRSSLLSQVQSDTDRIRNVLYGNPNKNYAYVSPLR